LGDSNGLGLAFWAETPSGKFEEMANMKTRKMSRGDEIVYKPKLKPNEEEYYMVYVNLYNDYRNIARAYDTLYIVKN
jgi:signal peptidase I